MAFTLAELRNHAQHACGGGSLSSQLDQDEIINEAGRYLFSMRSWHWARRRTTTLDYTASQNYISLPADFAEAISIAVASNTTGFEWASLEEINRLRQISTDPEFLVRGAIAYPTQTAQTSAPAVPVLEIWPTPAASLSPALYLAYRADWIELTAATHKPNIRPWMNRLLKELVRVFAQGFEESDEGLTDARLAAIAAGPIFDAACRRDAMDQPTYGRLRGGHIRRSGLPITWNPITIS